MFADDSDDAVDWAFLLLFLQMLSLQSLEIEECLREMLQDITEEGQREVRSMPQNRSRKPWYELVQTLDDKVFRRIFRMTRESFTILCSTIETTVGSVVFKSESWLNSPARPSPSNSIKGCAYAPLGGIIPGEMKIAIMIRILAGASYLDVLMAFNVASSTVFEVFREGINWIRASFKFPLVKWLEDENWNALQQISDDFAAASGDIFKGCFGALDGVAIKIRCPPLSDVIPDPGNYFCRKGFYALNAQVICDKHKRVIWASTGHKGSSHDSTAFLGTELFKLLQKMAPKLLARALFLVGDTAYPLLPFIMVPFPNAAAGSEEDAFNFWLSNSRIQIECTFGTY